MAGLIASGWHVAAIWMKLTVAHRARHDEARLGPSPGFRNMGWLEPVRPGDTLVLLSELVDKKASASRPQWGLVMMNNGARNQHGELAFRFDGVVFWERQRIAGARRRARTADASVRMPFGWRAAPSRSGSTASSGSAGQKPGVLTIGADVGKPSRDGGRLPVRYRPDDPGTLRVEQIRRQEGALFSGPQRRPYRSAKDLDDPA